MIKRIYQIEHLVRIWRGDFLFRYANNIFFRFCDVLLKINKNVNIILAEANCRNRGNMTVSYNKLWETLIDRKMSRADLRKAAEIAPNTMTKMRRDELAHLNILGRI